MMPRHYDPRKVGDLFLENPAGIAESVPELPPAESDKVRIAAFGIDCQVSFCHPGASLFVPGAVEDSRRTVEWIYRNAARLTTLVFSLDTHSLHQIFHPVFWAGRDGRAPSAFTVITAKDVRDGTWTPRHAPKAAALEYCERLEKGGKYVLTIWPYHVLQGGLGNALLPSIHEAALYHGFARRTEPVFEVKGRHPMTENFSVLSPEVRELQGRKLGEFNAPLFDLLMGHDRVYVFGQAKSHCVLSTLRDLEEECRRRDPALLNRICILEDAMSPVPAVPGLDFPALAEAGICDLGSAGMNIARTGDDLR
jgi:nicotinamidase-related amidase